MVVCDWILWGRGVAYSAGLPSRGWVGPPVCVDKPSCRRVSAECYRSVERGLSPMAKRHDLPLGVGAGKVGPTRALRVNPVPPIAGSLDQRVDHARRTRGPRVWRGPIPA
jgi:hypothetical protein